MLRSSNSQIFPTKVQFLRVFVGVWLYSHALQFTSYPSGSGVVQPDIHLIIHQEPPEQGPLAGCQELFTLKAPLSFVYVNAGVL